MTAPAVWRKFRIGFLVLRARTGVTGMTGLVLILVAAAVTLSGLRLELLKQRMLLAQYSAAQGSNQQLPAPLILSTAVINVEAQFPLLREVSGILSSVYQQALTADLSISAADYSWAPPTDSAPGQYEMIFRLNGEYVPIRKFIQTVLNKEPAVALRALTLARDTTAGQQILANIRLVIFVRAD